MRKKSTIEIDTKKGLEYYARFIAVIDAHKALRAYEKENKFPDTIQLHFNDQTPFGFELNRDGTITEDTFANVMRYSLQKKQSTQGAGNWLAPINQKRQWHNN